MIQTVRTVATLDLALLAVLVLVLVAAVAGWVLEAMMRAAAQFVRAGEINPGQGRQLLVRGGLGLATYAVSAVLVRVAAIASEHLR